MITCGSETVIGFSHVVGRVGNTRGSAYASRGVRNDTSQWIWRARFRLEPELLWRELPGPVSLLSGLISFDGMRRRRGYKMLTRSLPFRPTLRLLQFPVSNRSFLDGSAGVVYARMMAAYESMMTTRLAPLRSGIRL